MSTIEDAPPVPKIEPFEEESFSESSPEPEDQSIGQEPAAQVQKRKGGRKPVGSLAYAAQVQPANTSPDIRYI